MQAVRPNPTAIILAAGASQRMGCLDKLLLPLCGKPIILYVVESAELVARGPRGLRTALFTLRKLAS